MFSFWWAGVACRVMTSQPRRASRKGWKLPVTRQRTTWPSITTSLTPEARAICRAGGVPRKVASTRCVGVLCAHALNVGSGRRAVFGGTTDLVRS